MIGEVRRRIDEAVEAQKLDDAVEIAQSNLCLRQNVERAETRSLLAFGEVGIGADLAGNGDLAVPHGKLARDEEQTIEMKEGDIAAESGLGLWEGKVERLQPCFYLSCHDRLHTLASGPLPQGLDH